MEILSGRRSSRSFEYSLQNVAISRSCFVKNGKEMNKEFSITHACSTAIVLVAVAVEVQLVIKKTP